MPGVAQMDMLTGECFLNADTFPQLPPNWQAFILLHEQGHYVLNTRDELEVDSYAFYEYAKTGRSLYDSILAQTRILDESNPEHRMRVAQQERRCRWWDYHMNGNERAR